MTYDAVEELLGFTVTVDRFEIKAGREITEKFSPGQANE
jgi:hypothetical protein